MADEEQLPDSNASSDERSWPLTYGDVRIDQGRALEAFKVLAGMFYERNFSTASKSEIELVMFKAFNEAAGDMTDFALAKQLGTTPQIVRNRRTKLALRGDLTTENWNQVFLNVLDSKTYVIRASKSGPEMKIMFPRKMDVYEFEDVLLRYGHYFDNSFNNLVVVTPMSAVLHVLYEEVGGVEMRKGAGKQSVVGFIQSKLGKSELDESTRKVIDRIWGDEVKGEVKGYVSTAIEEALKVGIRAGVKSAAIPALTSLASALSSVCKCVFRLTEDNKGEYEIGESDKSRIDLVEKIAGILSNEELLNIDRDSLSEKESKSFEAKGEE